MSFEAVAWAAGQGDCSSPAKFVLIAIANYADEVGECWPSRKMLASFTNQSVETISRRLKELEQEGYIERLERTRDNGSRTSDCIRLLMDRAPDAPPRQSEEGGPLVNMTRPPCQYDEAPLVTVDEAPSSLLTRPEPSIEPSEGNIPPNPLQGDAGRVSSQENGKEDGGDAATALDAFLAAYPMAPEHAPHEARRPWARMTQAERAKAMLALPRYVDHARRRKIALRSPGSYLRSRIWDKPEFLDAPSAPAAAAPRGDLDAIGRAVQWARSDAGRDGWVFVDTGTEAWAAWQAAFRHAGYAPPGAASSLTHDGHGGYERRMGRSFPMRFPPRANGPEPPGEAAAE